MMPCMHNEDHTVAATASFATHSTTVWKDVQNCAPKIKFQLPHVS